ncbi:MAG: glycosyltransferase [Eggerthellaceae bacterium]|nr:glycosyltransferase [Eggerthellaceae bacterium]
MPKVSILIPVYNAIPYLRQCLDSIKAQTLQDIEVLCINDGSKDDSLAVMNEYAAADSRFKVLDKPNGGYGHSLNYGLDHATGEFIGIVEPDDFIDEHMYEDLLSYQDFGGKPADIVKGSYVQFYDGRNGYGDAVTTSALTEFMPKVPTALTIDDHPGLSSSHPCIWTAIYRRSFLESEGIRFMEPKGAGWADNPFMQETLVAAKRIVWVPKNYYYYRQTNMSSSSFLKDFRIPFDRTREMREVLRRRNASAKIWEALYVREFSYINFVLGECGFSETDPEVHSLVLEMLEDMDRDLVLSSKCFAASDIDFYNSFLAAAHAQDNAEPEASEEQPVVSFLVPVLDNRRTMAECLSSLNALEVEHEVICVDCGSHDSSPMICKRVCNTHANVRMLDGSFESVPQGLNAALDASKGRYSMVIDPSMSVDARLSSFIELVAESSSDIALLDNDMRYVVDALRAANALDAVTVQTEEFVAAMLPAGAESISGFAFDVAHANEYARIYRNDFIREQGLSFDSCDVMGDASFGMRATIAAASIAYGAFNCMSNADRFIEWPLFYLELDEQHQLRSERSASCRRVTPSILKGIEAVGDERYAVSLSNVLASAFAWDIVHTENLEELHACIDEELPAVRACLERLGNEYCWHRPREHRVYELLAKGGVEEFLEDRMLYKDYVLRLDEQALADMKDSPTMRLGTKLAHAGRIVMPRKAIAAVKNAFRK